MPQFQAFIQNPQPPLQPLPPLHRTTSAPSSSMQYQGPQQNMILPSAQNFFHAGAPQPSSQGLSFSNASSSSTQFNTTESALNSSGSADYSRSFLSAPSSSSIQPFSDSIRRENSYRSPSSPHWQSDNDDASSQSSNDQLSQLSDSSQGSQTDSFDRFTAQLGGLGTSASFETDDMQGIRGCVVCCSDNSFAQTC